MAHSKLPGKGGKVCVRKHLVDEPQVFAHHNGVAIAHGDTGRLLPAVLQSFQTKVGEPRHIASGRPYTKDAALLMQRVLARSLACTLVPQTRIPHVLPCRSLRGVRWPRVVLQPPIMAACRTSTDAVTEFTSGAPHPPRQMGRPATLLPAA